MTVTPHPTRWGCPDSQLVLRAAAPRERWLKMRTAGLGGSDLSALLGFNKYSSAYGVWLSKTGRSVDKETNQAMRMGNKLEPIIKELFVEDHGIRVRAAGLHRSRTVPIMQVSVDGLTEDGGIIECKSTSGWLRDEWEDDQIPDHAELQAMHGMAVTGRSHAWVCGLIDGREFITRRVERDAEMIANLRRIEQEWWDTYVGGDVEPPLTAVSLGEVKSRWPNEDAITIDQPFAVVQPIRERIVLAKLNIKKFETEQAQAEAELRNLAGPAEQLTADGDPFATFKSTGTFASTKFKENHPDLAETYTVQKPGINTDLLKVEHPDVYNNFRSRVLRFPTPKKVK